jgi:hypothetical protein
MNMDMKSFMQKSAIERVYEVLKATSVHLTRNEIAERASIANLGSCQTYLYSLRKIGVVENNGHLWKIVPGAEYIHPRKSVESQPVVGFTLEPEECRR